MQRHAIALRDNWKERLDSRGFLYIEESFEAPYWSEGRCYKFSSAEIDEIEDATNRLHIMCCDAAQYVIDKKLYNRFGIPEEYHDYIATTWEREYPSVYGRFDLAFDGSGPPKLLEYNADTPTSLFETAVLQWDWLKDHDLPDQFNSVHERLVETWAEVANSGVLPNPLYFTGYMESLEDWITIEYMRDTCEQGGIKTKAIDISDIGWDGKDFRDLEEEEIYAFFKLYPWEWMAKENFGKHLVKDQVGVIEPAWKMLLSNKAILPLLWEMNPDHELLLPTYDSENPFHGRPHVKKAKLGREGASVEIRHPLHAETAEGPYGSEGYVYQEYAELPSFEGKHAVIGSWVVGGKACGVGIREDSSRITKDNARYVPHYFEL